MRYFYHLRTEVALELDPEGSEFPDLAVAEQEAVLAAREMMSDAILRGDDISGRSFEIEDDQGIAVLSVPFRSAIRAA